MKRFKDVEHLVRLAALFLGGVLVFSIARAELVTGCRCSRRCGYGRCSAS